MTKCWHSTCSKIPNNHNITHDDKKHQTSKALHYILGGNGCQLCCASNIKCFSCSRKTKSTNFVTVTKTNYSTLGECLLKYTKNYKITHNHKPPNKDQKHNFSHWVETADNHAMIEISSVCPVAEGVNQLNL